MLSNVFLTHYQDYFWKIFFCSIFNFSNRQRHRFCTEYSNRKKDIDCNWPPNKGLSIDFSIFVNFTENLPNPKIITRGHSLECVSLYVNNSNDVWWIDHEQLSKGEDYTVETINNQTHNPYNDTYNRLKLTFLKPKLKIFKKIQDDTRRSTLYFNSTFPFECRARFDTETLIYNTNVVDYEGKYLWYYWTFSLYSFL